jgi:hypothetical protein
VESPGPHPWKGKIKLTLDDAGNAGNTCPYLGTRSDPTTCLHYPSPRNNCHRARPPAPVRLPYQEQYCLSVSYAACVVFRSSKIGPLPASIRESHIRTGRRPPTAVVAVVVAALVVGIGLSVSLGVLPFPVGSVPQVAIALPPAVPSPIGMDLVSPTEPAQLGTVLPQFPSVDLGSSTPVPSSAVEAFSVQSSPTVRPTSTTYGACGHQLDEPIGPGRQFIVHRVQTDESLPMYETKYGTNADAIQGVNANTVVPLQPGELIIIPLFQQSVVGVPPFRPYQLYQQDARLSRVAGDVGASSIADFMFYNGYTFNECLTFAGWVLVPRAGPRPTPTLDCRPSGYQSAIICYPTPTPTHKEHGN